MQPIITRSFLTRSFALLTAAFALTACDVEDFGADLGADETPIEEMPGEDPVPVYSWLIIEDTSVDMNTAGAPGADICGVEFSCPDALDGRRIEGYGVEAILEAGAGEHCIEGETVNGEPCFADRDDARAALDAPQMPCEADSAPSHYVALGLGGRLAVRVDTNSASLGEHGLLGCDVVVHERPGREREGYRVSVCADPDGLDCLAPRPVAASPEGDLLSLSVPADIE